MTAKAQTPTTSIRWYFLILLISITTYSVNPASGSRRGDEQTVVVDTTSTEIDGHTTTVETLKNDPGPDGVISFLEALLAIQNSGPGYTIRFGLPVGATIELAETHVLRPGGTVIDGDVDDNGTPDIIIDGPDGFISLLISSSNNTLRNLVISGLSIEGVDARDNVITSNYLGTNLAGTSPGTNSGHAIQILDNANHNLIENNIISGTGDNDDNTTHTGIFLLGGAADNQIEGNRIGVGANGAALPNDVGIFVTETASGNQIGGTRLGGCVAPCNVISGNHLFGIILDEGATTNVVAGNYIGTDEAGRSALPNGTSGILLGSGASSNTIGGYRPNGDLHRTLQPD